MAARADEHFDLDEDELHRRALARRSALEDLAEHDLGLFIELHTPQYERPEHLGDLTGALDRSMSEPVFALVEIAPRFGKTETFLHGMSRRLRYRRRDDVAYCSYSSPLALRKSRKARDIAARAGVWAEEAKTVLRDRMNPASAVSYWQTVDGGSFTAGGRNGAFVGDGYGMIVYDDPFKNRGEAESPVIQEKAIETWRGLATRIEPGGSGFITHQAWNDHDPIALMKAEMGTPDGQDWELISLPAVFDAEYDDDDTDATRDVPNDLHPFGDHLGRGGVDTFRRGDQYCHPNLRMMSKRRAPRLSSEAPLAKTAYRTTPPQLTPPGHEPIKVTGADMTAPVNPAHAPIACEIGGCPVTYV